MIVHGHELGHGVEHEDSKVVLILSLCIDRDVLIRTY